MAFWDKFNLKSPAKDVKNFFTGGATKDDYERASANLEKAQEIEPVPVQPQPSKNLQNLQTEIEEKKQQYQQRQNEAKQIASQISNLRDQGKQVEALYKLEDLQNVEKDARKQYSELKGLTDKYKKTASQEQDQYFEMREKHEEKRELGIQPEEEFYRVPGSDKPEQVYRKVGESVQEVESPRHLKQLTGAGTTEEAFGQVENLQDVKLRQEQEGLSKDEMFMTDIEEPGGNERGYASPETAIREQDYEKPTVESWGTIDKVKEAARWAMPRGMEEMIGLTDEGFARTPEEQRRSIFDEMSGREALEKPTEYALREAARKEAKKKAEKKAKERITEFQEKEEKLKARGEQVGPAWMIAQEENPLVFTKSEAEQQTSEEAMKLLAAENYKEAREQYETFLKEQAEEDQGFGKEFWQGVKRKSREPSKTFLPYIGPTVRLKDSLETLGAYKQKALGKDLNEYEKSFIAKEKARSMRGMQDVSRGERIGKMITEMPRWMLEIMGGLKAIKEPVGSALKHQLSKGLSEGIASKLAALGGLEAHALTANMPRVAADTAKYMIPAYKRMDADTLDEFYKELGGKDAFRDAFARSFGENTIELASEYAGFLFEDSVDWLAKATLGKSLDDMGLEAYLGRGMAPKRLAKSIRWDGIIGEVFEEELAEMGQAPIAGRSYRNPLTTQEGRERLLVETLGLAPFGLLMGAGNFTVNELRQKFGDGNRPTIGFDDITRRSRALREENVPMQAEVGLPLEQQRKESELFKPANIEIEEEGIEFKDSQQTDYAPPEPNELTPFAKDLIEQTREVDYFDGDPYDYDAYRQVILNEPGLYQQMERVAEREIGETEGEGKIDPLLDEIQNELDRQRYEEQEAKKEFLQDKGRMHHVKEAIRGQNWEEAKQTVKEMQPTGEFFQEEPEITDQEAQDAFERLYRTTEQAGYLDLDRIRERLGGIKRLTDINPEADEKAESEAYEEKYFLDRYWGRYDKRFEEGEKIKVYRGVPRADAELRPGDYVTPDQQTAQSYTRTKFGTVLTNEVPAEDLIVARLGGMGGAELIYYPEGAEAEASAEEEVTPDMTFREFYEQVQREQRRDDKLEFKDSVQENSELQEEANLTTEEAREMAYSVLEAGDALEVFNWTFDMTNEVGKDTTIDVRKVYELTEDLADSKKQLIREIAEQTFPDEFNALEFAKEVQAAVTPLDFEGFTDVTTRLLKELRGKNLVSKQFIKDKMQGLDLRKYEKDRVMEALNHYPNNQDVPVEEFANRVKTRLLPLKSKDKGGLAAMKNRQTEPDTETAWYGYTYKTGDTGLSERIVNEPVVEHDEGETILDRDNSGYTERMYSSPVETAPHIQKIKRHWGQQKFPRGITGFRNLNNYFAHVRFDEKIRNWNDGNILPYEDELLDKTYDKIQEEKDLTVDTNKERLSDIMEDFIAPREFRGAEMYELSESEKQEVYEGISERRKMPVEDVKDIWDVAKDTRIRVKRILEMQSDLYQEQRWKQVAQEGYEGFVQAVEEGTEARPYITDHGEALLPYVMNHQRDEIDLEVEQSREGWNVLVELNGTQVANYKAERATPKSARKEFKRNFGSYSGFIKFLEMSELQEEEVEKQIERWRERPLSDLEEQALEILEYSQDNLPTAPEFKQTTKERLEPYQDYWYERILREELKKSAGYHDVVQIPQGEQAMKIQHQAKGGWMRSDAKGPEIDSTDVLEEGEKVAPVTEDGQTKGDHIVTEILDEERFKSVRVATATSIVEGYVRNKYDIEGRVENSENEEAQEEFNELLGKEEEKIVKNAEDIPDAIHERVMERAHVRYAEGIDQTHPIHIFYDQEIPKFLKDRFDGVEDWEKRGFTTNPTWTKIDVDPEMANEPVVDFHDIKDIEEGNTSQYQEAVTEAEPQEYEGDLSKAPLKVEFEEKDYIEFPGSRIQGAADVAFAFDQLTNQIREELWLVAEKGDAPVAAELVARGDQNSVPANPQEVIPLLKQTDADGFYLVHNHTSHDPSPSEGDRKVHRRFSQFAKESNREFKGDVVINNQEYGWLRQADGGVQTGTSPLDVEVNTEGVEVPRLEGYQDFKVDTPSDRPVIEGREQERLQSTAELLKGLKQDWENQKLVIFMTTGGIVRQVKPLKKDLALWKIAKDASMIRAPRIVLVNSIMGPSMTNWAQERLRKVFNVYLDDVVKVENGQYVSYRNEVFEGGEPVIEAQAKTAGAKFRDTGQETNDTLGGYPLTNRAQSLYESVQDKMELEIGEYDDEFEKYVENIVERDSKTEVDRKVVSEAAQYLNTHANEGLSAYKVRLADLYDEEAEISQFYQNAREAGVSSAIPEFGELAKQLQETMSDFDEEQRGIANSFVELDTNDVLSDPLTYNGLLVIRDWLNQVKQAKEKLTEEELDRIGDRDLMLGLAGDNNINAIIPQRTLYLPNGETLYVPGDFRQRIEELESQGGQGADAGQPSGLLSADQIDSEEEAEWQINRAESNIRRIIANKDYGGWEAAQEIVANKRLMRSLQKEYFDTYQEETTEAEEEEPEITEIDLANPQDVTIPRKRETFEISVDQSDSTFEKDYVKEEVQGKPIDLGLDYANFFLHGESGDWKLSHEGSGMRLAMGETQRETIAAAIDHIKTTVSNKGLAWVKKKVFGVETEEEQTADEPEEADPEEATQKTEEEVKEEIREAIEEYSEDLNPADMEEKVSKLYERFAVLAHKGVNIGRIVQRETILDRIEKGQDMAEREGYRKAKKYLRKVKDDIYKYAKNKLDPEHRGKLNRRIRDAKNEGDVLEAYSYANKLANRVKKKELKNKIIKTQKKALKSPNVAVDFKQRIRDLLDDYELQGHQQSTIDKWESTKEYIERQREQGNEVEMPQRVLDNLEALARKPLDAISVAEMESIYDEIQRLEKLGRKKWSLIEKQQAREQQMIKQKLLENVTPIKKSPKFEAGVGENLTLTERFRNQIREKMDIMREKDKLLMPIDVLMDMLDGREGTYNGAHFNLIKGTIDRDFSAFLRLKNELQTPVEELAVELELDDSNFERIGFVAVRRQEGGVEKLKNLGYSESEIEEVELNEKEQQFLDKMQEKFDEQFPYIKEIMRTTFNAEVNRVKNYFPFMTDWKKSRSRKITKKLSEESDEVGQQVPGGWLTKKTEQSFTKSRKAAGDQKVKINAMEVYKKHMKDVAYLRKFGKDVKMLYEIVNSDEYREAAGKQGQLFMTEYMDLIARQGGKAGESQIEAIDKLRRNVGVGILGYKLTTVMIQWTPIIDAAGEIGTKYTSEGVKNVTTSKEWREMVYQFPEMQKRFGGEYALQELEKLSGETTLENLRNQGFKPLQMLDGAAAAGTAAGAYIKKMEEMGKDPVATEEPNEEAMQYAQKVVRQTQASGLYKDQPLAVTRGFFRSGKTGQLIRRSLSKALFQFQTFNLFARWARFRYDIYETGIRGSQKKKAASRLASMLIAIMAASGSRMAVYSIMDMLTGKDDERDRELSQQLMYELVGSAPFAGNIMSMVVYRGEPLPILQAPATTFMATEQLFSADTPNERAQALAKFTQGMGQVSGIPGSYELGGIAEDMLEAREDQEKEPQNTYGAPDIRGGEESRSENPYGAPGTEKTPEGEEETNPYGAP